jgi:antitoxin MazE
MRDHQMAHLIRIGNSQGIRIPKPLIEQAQLEGKELTLQLVEGGLLISPDNNARAGWEAIIEQAIAAGGQESVDREWLDLPLDSDDDLEW